MARSSPVAWASLWASICFPPATSYAPSTSPFRWRVYCHYGPTEVKTLAPLPRDFPWTRDVLRAIEAAWRRYPNPDYFTFSGNGEPTLHPAFPDVAAAVRRLRDELDPGVKLALFSNATTVHLPRVRQALSLFDAPILKLDAGDPETLARINRPAPGVELARIVEGLKRVPNLIIQSVLIDGQVSNIRGRAFEAWVEALADIRPARVQIYSGRTISVRTDYPVPEAGVERVPPYVLRRIAGEVERRAGVRVEAYWM